MLLPRKRTDTHRLLLRSNLRLWHCCDGEVLWGLDGARRRTGKAKRSFERRAFLLGLYLITYVPEMVLTPYRWRRNSLVTAGPIRPPLMPGRTGGLLAWRRSDWIDFKQAGRHSLSGRRGWRGEESTNKVFDSSHKAESSRNGTACETTMESHRRNGGRSWTQVASLPFPETFQWSRQHQAFERHLLLAIALLDS